jgi:hypothetical protein
MEQNTTSVVIEQQGENKKRGALAVILAVAFVAMLGIGSTFAYLTWTGNQTPNRFTVDTPLSGDLVEPLWVKGTEASRTAKDTDGSSLTEKAADGTIIPLAAGMTEKGTMIAKNPYVVNTSFNGTTGSRAYAAVRLTFQKWQKDSTTEATGSLDQGTLREQGKYVNMTPTEVINLLGSYSFSTVDSTDEGATAPTSAGLSVDDNWTLVDKNGKAVTNVTPDGYNYLGSDDGATEGTGGQIYYVYKYALSAPTDYLTSEYPEAGGGKSAAVATTELFKSVTQVDDPTSSDGPLGKLLTSLKVNGTQLPGWRVLIDNTMAYAPAVDSDATEGNTNAENADYDKAYVVTQDAMTSLKSAFDSIEVRSDGASPVNGYNYTAGKGSGTAKNISTQDDAGNGRVLPEVTWQD